MSDKTSITRRLENIFMAGCRRLLLPLGFDVSRIGDGQVYLTEIRRERADRALLLTGYEAFQLMTVAASTAKVPGDLAELGVYRGASARLICQVKGDRELHLFDTFSGLPPITANDVGFFTGAFAADIGAVRQRVADYPNVSIHPGLFPGSADPLYDRRFSFVHLDADLYESTRAALHWFYPRLTAGGVILCHDYFSSGVKKAISEFLSDKPEIVAPAAGSYGLIIRVPTTS